MQPASKPSVFAFALAAVLAIMAALFVAVDAFQIGGCCQTSECGNCTAVNGGSGKNPTGNCNSFLQLVTVKKFCFAADCMSGCNSPNSRTCLAADYQIKCVIL